MCMPTILVLVVASCRLHCRLADLLSAVVKNILSGPPPTTCEAVGGSMWGRAVSLLYCRRAVHRREVYTPACVGAKFFSVLVSTTTN